MRHMVTYKLLDAVARFGSIRKAAEHTALTPSALNRRILTLEEEFGVEIFERTNIGLKLNAAGEIIIHHARKQMADLERVQSQLADMSGLRRGHVTIFASQSALEGFLPFEIAAYKSEHPSVTFSLQQAEAEASLIALQDFRADLAIAYNLGLHENLQILGQFPQSIYAIFPEDHPLASQQQITLADCSQHELALPAAGAGLRTVLDDQAKKQGLTLTPSLESNAFAALATIGLKSDLVSFRLSMTYENTEVPKGHMYKPLVDVKGGAISVAQLKGRTLSIAASRLIEQLQARIEI